MQKLESLDNDVTLECRSIPPISKVLHFFLNLVANFELLIHLISLNKLLRSVFKSLKTIIYWNSCCRCFQHLNKGVLFTKAVPLKKKVSDVVCYKIFFFNFQNFEKLIICIPEPSKKINKFINKSIKIATMGNQLQRLQCPMQQIFQDNHKDLQDHGSIWYSTLLRYLCGQVQLTFPAMTLGGKCCKLNLIEYLKKNLICIMIAVLLLPCINSSDVEKFLIFILKRKI